MKKEISKLKEELSFARIRGDTTISNIIDVIEKLERTNSNAGDVISKIKKSNTQAEVLQKGIIKGPLVADNLLTLEWENNINTQDKIEYILESPEFPIITLDSVRIDLRRLDVGSRALSRN